MNEEFITNITRCQNALLIYIRSITSSSEEADDILQRTNLVLWKKHEKYESGTNFTAWACRVAYYEVLAYRKEKSREKDRLQFSDDLLEMIADKSLELIESVAARKQALLTCLKKLPEEERTLVEKRHIHEVPVKELALEDTRTDKGIYKALARIHNVLRLCISKELSG